MTRSTAWLFLCSCLVSTGCSKSSTELSESSSPDNGFAETIYLGGEIITLDDEQLLVDSLAVSNGLIQATGSRESVEDAYRGPKTEIIDLQGKAMIPAFIDAHSHYMHALSAADQAQVYAPPAGPGRDVDSIIQSIEAFRTERAIPPGQIVQAYGYDDTVMPDGRLLNRDDLDRAFPDNPVIVGHVSMHGAVLNSAALELYEFSSETETPAGGVIVRKPGTNEPYGLIMETAYIPIFASLPKPSLENELALSLAAQRLYASHGITLAHDGTTHADELRLMQRVAASGEHIIDVVAYPFMTDIEEIVAENPASSWGEYRHGLKIGGVKITADGSPQGRTAYFSTPYLTGGPGGEQVWYGEPTVSQDELNALVARVYGLGVPLIIHTNGDAAIDLFLNAYEKVRDGDFSRRWNVTTIHTQFVRPDQIYRFVDYDIRPSFYTLHTYYFADAHEANRGKKQASYISPMRDAIDAGLRPSNHTDFFVAPLDQMFMMWSAVNRKSRSGSEVGSDQRVSPLEALKAQTLWAAEQYDEGHRRGSLEVGKIADLVILDRNPLSVDPDDIKDIRVIETVKDGVSIFGQDP